MGFGCAPGHDWLTMDPHRDGLSETEERGMVLKKPPRGSSPSRSLWEMLKMMRFVRFVSSFGKPPVRWLNDKSTDSSSVKFAIPDGIPPVMLFSDKILQIRRI